MRTAGTCREREPGIDLLRCVGLFFVVSFHFFLYSGFYYEPQIGGWMLAADSFRWLSYACNGIFMTLTGYLKSTEPLSKRYYRSLPPVLLGYALASAVSIPVRHFALGDVQALGTWIERFFNFRGCYYGWYVEMYIGLLLFSPVINLALRQCRTKKQLLWLALTMLMITALPSVTDIPLIPDYWTSLYPITFYVLGAVIRRLRIKLNPMLGLSLAVLISFGIGSVTFLSTDKTISDAYVQDFGTFYTTITVLCIFLSLYRLRPGPRLSKVLAWMSGGCFEGYLLSHLLDSWVYRMIPAWRTPEKYYLLFLCLAVPIYIVSIIAGKLLHTVVKALLKRKVTGSDAVREQKNAETIPAA